MFDILFEMSLFKKKLSGAANRKRRKEEIKGGIKNSQPIAQFMAGKIFSFK